MSDGRVTKSDVKYLRAIASHPDPVVTVTEVADSIDVSQQAAHKKLSQLEERGLVKSKKTGARSRVWWLTTTGREAYSESLS